MGVLSRFWCRCSNAGRADGQPWALWVKEIVTMPPVTLILPKVIRT